MTVMLRKNLVLEIKRGQTNRTFMASYYWETRNWLFCDNRKKDKYVKCFCFQYFQEDVEVEDIKKFKAVLMESFDTNKDGKIGKDELKLLLVAQKS